MPAFSRDRLLLGAILLTAFGLRWLYILQSQASPFFDFPLIDAKTYTATATALAGQGQWLGGPAPFWQPPLYPYFLGVLFKLFGPDLYLARLAQALIGTLNCALVFFMGRRFFTPGIGLVAAAGAALYGPFLFYEAEFLPPVLAIGLNLLLLLSLPWAAEQARRRWIPGLLAGLSALCVANILLFLPLAAWWLWRRDEGLPPRRRRALPLLAGALLAIAPVTARNYLVGGDWVLISANAGINFYIGNNAEYDRTLHIQPGRAWTDLVSRPRLEAGLTRPSAQSRFFLAQSWDFITKRPGDYLLLLVRKSYQLLHGDEIGRNQDLYFARQYAPLLGLLLWKYGLAFPFGVVAPLALLGMVLSLRRRNHDQQLLLVFAAVYALSIVLFFVSARYRLPLIPVLLLFAVHGAAAGYRLLRQDGAAVRTGLVAGVLGLLVLANIGATSMALAGDSETHHRLGYVYHQKGLLANAAAHYRRALDLDPTIPEARYNLGVVHALQGRYDRALEVFRAYIERFPERREARYALGNALLKTHRYLEAIGQYEQLLEVESTVDPVALQGRLAYTYLQVGQLERAAAAYRALLQARPDSLAVRYQLGRLHESQTRPSLARQQYGEILRRDPTHAEARLRLAGILLVAGEDPAAAKKYLYQLLAYDPDHVGARWLLASQYVAEHDGPAALEQAEAILRLDPSHKQANWLAGHLHYIVQGDTLTGVGRLEQLKKVHIDERAAQFEKALKQSMLDMLAP